MSDEKDRRSNKVSTVLSDDMRREAQEVSDRLHISLQDMLRQGLARVLIEVRDTGTFSLVAYEAPAEAMEA